jgi:2-polyprenyl-6-methoxyphenol hydroxylase-like FAD-dependent oxidoreductase
VLNGKTGEVVSTLPFNNFYRFLRSRFRAFMADGIDISFGKRLAGLSYTDDDGGHGPVVTAHFDDGTSERGRLVIGADGSNSRVRSLLVGAERAKLKRLPTSATFINASFTREQALFLRSYHPLATVIVHPESQMGMLAALDIADDDRPETWRFCFYISWCSSVAEQDADAATMGPRERLAQAKARAKDYADPLRSAHEWLPDHLETVYWTANANWDPSLEEHAWDNHGGLATLAGDAAHAMTYRKWSACLLTPSRRYIPSLSDG